MIHTETDFLTVLAERLARLRADQGMTIEQIAEVAGVSPRQWIRWEQGLHSMPAYAIYRLVRTLDVPADTVLP